MKILTIIGARPQFIKAAAISRAIAYCEDVQETLVHTGQHYDANMSDVFFEELGISHPDFQLDIHGGNHGEMTGRMLGEIEKVLLSVKPDRVLVYGDTNSTLAGALAAAKLHIPVAHVEAGLRSFNMRMPEEINRILTDRISDLLFCPTETAVQNLINEGYKPSDNHQQVLNVGDVMQDSALMFAKFAAPPKDFSLESGFVLATLHRAENTDDTVRLSSTISALNEIHGNLAPVVLPLHPRTRDAIKNAGLNLDVHVIDPVGYLEMIWLLKQCGLVLTDSGGVQKEAFFFGKACVTMRDQTEWVELIDMGVNELVGADKDRIIAATSQNLGRLVEDPNQLYGGGQAASKIVAAIFAGA